MDQQAIARKSIGLLFLSDYEKWSGGMIYILNIVRALNTLEDALKPKLVIIHGPTSPIEDLFATQYPYLDLIPADLNPSFAKKAFNKIRKIVTGKSIYYHQLPETVYPYNESICLGKKPYYWIPDFQEWYLPEMFPDEEVKSRKHNQLVISKSGSTVVFSSESARKDFVKFFPKHTCNLKLLRFASALPPFSHVDLAGLKSKYGIDRPFFMSPNQFWKHKNHIVILKAIKALSKENLDFQVVFTGSENDYRNKDYFQTLKTYITENGLERWIRFLGFIPRADQLVLMSNAISIIQPSLFEGWSTVVEDTKALSQFILLSDIDVHKEQIQQNCMFFPAHSDTELATRMRELLVSGAPRKEIDYNSNIYNFGKDILDVLA
ncbi:glycosyltransferase [Dyadobacter sandarakinus]|uniref:Glycosyltransferase n=1 Tax=Dyadobacter sandarakinus TaxID=2747268 RepID=A0ABX7IBN4_9BACT|nr:glycosyltransferase [Dyadobacter sandarakinus]QRR03395.1 glycosyltransferase [Dyadobacter sandarakinus]